MVPFFVWRNAMEEFIKINGVLIKAPATCTYTLIDLSSEASGRQYEDGFEYKDCIAQKRKLTCKWAELSARDAQMIAQYAKKKGVYVDVTFWDIANGRYETMKCTTGDFSCTYSKGWSANRKYVGNTSVNFIEA